MTGKGDRSDMGERILITHATLVTLDEQSRVLRDSSISIKDGKIEAIGAESGSYTRTIDGSGWILLPGLVNAHTHSPMTLLRGLRDDCTLEEWLNGYIWPAESTLTREDYYVGAQLGIAEMLATGTTSVSDMYRCSGELIRAAAETGIKANICESMTADDAFDPKTHAGIRESEQTFADWNGYDGGRIRIDTSIQSCWQTTPKFWRHIAEFAKERSMGVHVHLAETREEMAHCQSTYGASPVALLEAAGVLENRVIAVHGIWFSEADREILRSHDVHVVHDPASNYKFCCGFAELKPCREKRIALALGSDGVCSNNSADLFDTMKSTALIQKMLTGDPCFLPAEEILRIAVQGGLGSQGRAGEAGSLRPGMDADIIAVDRDFPSMLPGSSPMSDLVYAGSGAMVRMTMVRGKILYENGCFTTIDMEKLKWDVKRITGMR